MNSVLYTLAAICQTAPRAQQTSTPEDPMNRGTESAKTPLNQDGRGSCHSSLRVRVTRTQRALEFVTASETHRDLHEQTTLDLGTHRQV